MTPQELHLSILERAFQGRLTERESSTETGYELLNQIKAEKLRLIRARAIKKEKELPPITDDDIPFEIPETWAWAYVGDIFLHNTGKAQNSSGYECGVIRKFITTSNLYWNRFDFTKVKEMPFTEKELERCTVKKGDLLVCEGGDCGRSAIWNYDEEVCIQNHVHRLRPILEISIEYFYHLFYLYKFTGKLRGRGVGIQGLSNDAIHQVICPLPPLAEQKRIVAKIEELLPYIDRYEQAWSKLEDFNKRFPVDMQKSILQMAIQGKLVEQRAEEGTGEELYQQIQAEKKRLIQAGEIKKEKPLSEIAEEEIPFEIPESWKWVRLSQLFSVLNGDRGKNYPAKSTLSHEGIPFISALNLDGKSVIEDDNLLCLSEQQYEKLGNGKLIRDDIVVCIRGSLGKHGRYPFDKGAIASSLVILRAFTNDDVLAEFLMMYLDTPLFFSEIRRYDNGTAQPNLAAKSLEQFLVPLPPFAEQKRIVAKLEEILPLCERLK